MEQSWGVFTSEGSCSAPRSSIAGQVFVVSLPLFTQAFLALSWNLLSAKLKSRATCRFFFFLRSADLSALLAFTVSRRFSVCRAESEEVLRKCFIHATGHSNMNKSGSLCH